MKIAYYRVSTLDQTIDAQRTAMGGAFDREFTDEGVSGGVMAAHRPGFAKLLDQVRAGDEVHVYAVDRLGRDALDVQITVRRLIDMGVTVHVKDLGPIGEGVGELILGVLAQVADGAPQDRRADGCWTPSCPKVACRDGAYPPWQGEPRTTLRKRCRGCRHVASAE